VFTRPLPHLFGLVLLLAAVGCAAPENPAGEFTPATPGFLTVATSLPALGFWNADRSEAVTGGFEYRIAAALADRLGLQLRIINIPFERLAVGDLGGADLAMAQITLLSERQRFVDFSHTYMTANSGVLVREGTQIRDLARAREARWVVEAGTTHETFVEQVVRPVEAPLVVRSREETLAALESGQVDAALLDLPIALARAYASGGALEVTGQFVTDQHLAAALPKGSPNLEAINSGIRALDRSRRLLAFEAEELRPVLGNVNPAQVPVIVARRAR
jgi:polar amino acid transport system substrate-binding protein